MRHLNRLLWSGTLAATLQLLSDIPASPQPVASPAPSHSISAASTSDATAAGPSDTTPPVNRNRRKRGLTSHYSVPPRNWYRYNQPPQYDSSYPPSNPDGQNPSGQYGSRRDEQPYNRSSPQAAAGYAPPGLVLPLVLLTSLSSRGAKDGDPVRASIARNIPLEGNAYLPAGAIVSGRVTAVKHNGFLEREGSLSIIFDELTLPDGRKLPLNAHLLGGLGDVGCGDVAYSRLHGSLSARQRMENMGVTSELGTAGEGGIGLAAAGAYGANFVRGLGSATSIVSAAGVLGNLFRHGKNVIIYSGMRFEIQLDSPLLLGSPDEQPLKAAPTRPESGF